MYVMGKHNVDPYQIMAHHIVKSNAYEDLINHRHHLFLDLIL